MFVCAGTKGICLPEFTDRRMPETDFRDLQRAGGSAGSGSSQ